MNVYKRPDSQYYWFKLMWDGRLIQRKTRVKNKKRAQQIADAFHTNLARGEVDLDKLGHAPTLREFSQQFADFVSTNHADKPQTVTFYVNRLKRLLEWEPLREARLNQIDEGLIARYISHRRKKVGITACNHELRTLRRALNLAREWKVIKTVPKIKLLPGENRRKFVLFREVERDYLAACPPLLHDVAVVMIDTGLRVGEAVALLWENVHLEPVAGSRYGWLSVRSVESEDAVLHSVKSDNAVRSVPLSSRVSGLLKERQEKSKSVWVFPGDSPDAPVLGTSLDHIHAEVCRPGRGKKRIYKFPAPFVLHSLRHTCLTRWGEAGMDAFRIKKLAGHSSITVSERYVHPVGEMDELVFDRLEALNQKALGAR